MAEMKPGESTSGSQESLGWGRTIVSLALGLGCGGLLFFLELNLTERYHDIMRPTPWLKWTWLAPPLLLLLLGLGVRWLRRMRFLALGFFVAAFFWMLLGGVCFVSIR